MIARLTLYQPDRPARRVLLDESRCYVIGRDADCALHIDDPRLSRRHARLEFDGRDWRLYDLCSKNGTLSDGRLVTECRLADGQWLDLGGVLAGFDYLSREGHEQELERLSMRWQTSVEMSRGLRSSLEPDELLTRVLESFVELAGAGRGFILLGPEIGEWRPDASFPDADADFSGSRTVVARALESGMPVVCSDVRSDTLLVEQASIVGGGISALVCMPLKTGARTLGVVYVDSNEEGKLYTDLDVEILQALADHAALVIGVARVRKDLVDLSTMLPQELSQGAPANRALIDKLEQLLPQLEHGRNDAPGVSGAAVAGADR